MNVSRDANPERDPGKRGIKSAAASQAKLLSPELSDSAGKKKSMLFVFDLRSRRHCLSKVDL